MEISQTTNVRTISNRDKFFDMCSSSSYFEIFKGQTCKTCTFSHEKKKQQRIISKNEESLYRNYRNREPFMQSIVKFESTVVVEVLLVQTKKKREMERRKWKSGQTSR